MKNLVYTLLVVCSSLCFVSCLDEQQPSLSLPLDDAFNSTNNLEATLVGAYSSLQTRPLGAANLTILGDLMADNVSWVGDNLSYSEIVNRTLGADNLDASELWSTGYNVINTANLVLEALPGLNDAEIEANRDRIAGECHFLRGMAHFELARFYAKPWNFTPDNNHLAVPIMLNATADLNETMFPERATLSAVYAQAFDDLQQAIALLPVLSESGRANTYVAYGYLMRMALQQGDFEKVVEYSEFLLNGPYALNPESILFFINEFSPESIFEIVNTVDRNPGGNASISAYYNVLIRGQIRLSTEFAVALNSIVTVEQQTNIANAGATFFDTRLTDLIIPPAFSNKYEKTTLDDNAPVMRLAEVILSRAEALAERDGVNQESVDLLNQIRLRSLRVVDALSGAPLDASQFVAYQLADFADKAALIDAIFLERQVELAFEGYRFHDLIRRGLPVKGLLPGDDKLVLPIPQREIDVNKKLKQNDGY